MDDAAATILHSAPLIAAAVAQLGTATGLTFAYVASGVVVTGRRLDAAFEPLHAAFTAAGWGTGVQHGASGADFSTRQSATFRPPWTLTRTNLPVTPPCATQPGGHGDAPAPAPAPADQTQDASTAPSAGQSYRP